MSIAAQTRRGGATLKLRWAHPRRWRLLREVRLVFGDTAAVATLVLDQDRGRVGLARGAGRPSRWVSAARGGTLRAAGLNIQVPPVQGSGPEGASVAMTLNVRTARELTVAAGATDDSGAFQAPAPLARIRARR